LDTTRLSDYSVSLLLLYTCLSERKRPYIASGATVTFLLRSPSVFDTDEVIQEHVKSGKARLVKGDAMVKEDLQRAWDEAATGDDGGVDLLLFTLGYTGAPKFHPLKGFTITPANLVTQALLNTLCTMPKSEPLPKVITISSTGTTRASHATLPLPLKPLYGYFLSGPHKDKLGSERVIAHCAGWEWAERELGEEIMGLGDWTKLEGLPAAGSLQNLAVVVRPALLTDGECQAEAPKKGKKAAYRAKASLSSPYTVSRKDVAHFLVEGLLKKWDEFAGEKVVEIAY